jgi:hypothetical protein
MAFFMPKNIGTDIIERYGEKMNNAIIQVDEMTVDLLRFMPYQEYLSTDYWKELRKSVFEKFGKVCFICGKTSNIHVHHFNYESRGHETFDDVVCLCEICHSTIHKYKSQIIGFLCINDKRDIGIGI